MRLRPKIELLPIETAYKGCLFRSRLEARWAVFFDHLKVPWLYESEGFNLDGTWYLPDFHVEGIGWIEIKPQEPTEEEARKANLLAYHSRENVFTFFGEIPYPSPENQNGYSAHAWLPHDGGVGWDWDYWWCRCTECGKVGIQYMGRSERICMHGKTDRGCNSDDEMLLEAYVAARSARFEKRNL